MKSKLRKIALALAVMLLVPIFAACGGGDSGGKKGAPIELTIYTQVSNVPGELVGWGAEVLLEKFNVKVNIINDGTDGTFQTRMAGGFLGDIVIFGSDGDEFQDAAEFGFLLDWEEDDLVKDYEYISQYFAHAMEKNRNITAKRDEDGNITQPGKIHGFGHNVAGSSQETAAFYYYPHLRYDLYQKLGFPVIETLEDFIPVLADMVAMEPVSDIGTKTYAVSSFNDWDGDMVMMVKSTAALYGWEEFHFGLYDTKTRTWEDCLKRDGWYIRCLKFYNTLNQMGLFDPDSQTQKYNGMHEKYLNGAAMFNIFEWIASAFNTDEHKEAGKVMAPVVAQDQINLADGLSVFGKNIVWTIGSNTQYPELCMEIINWFCSPEGTLTNEYGPRGLTWDFDEDGESYLTELGIQCQLDKENTIITYGDWTGTYKYGEFQHNNRTWAKDAVNPDSPKGQTFNYEYWDSTILNRVVTPIEQDWRDWTGFTQPDDWFVSMGKKTVAIATKYSKSKRSRELETIWKQVQNAIKENSWKAIEAKTDEEFNEYVDTMIEKAYLYGFEQCREWIEGEVEKRKKAEDEILSMG
ncbi:MAG: hypothetical protein FWG31_05265 [Oscillospiraceae bacterium]|nr:hypothetical protein [Oscillospiraceae bacterium]